MSREKAGYKSRPPSVGFLRLKNANGSLLPPRGLTLMTSTIFLWLFDRSPLFAFLRLNSRNLHSYVCIWVTPSQYRRHLGMAPPPCSPRSPPYFSPPFNLRHVKMALRQRQITHRTLLVSLTPLAQRKRDQRVRAKKGGVYEDPVP